MSHGILSLICFSFLIHSMDDDSATSSLLNRRRIV